MYCELENVWEEVYRQSQGSLSKFDYHCVGRDSNRLLFYWEYRSYPLVLSQRVRSVYHILIEVCQVLFPSKFDVVHIFPFISLHRCSLLVSIQRS